MRAWVPADRLACARPSHGVRPHSLSPFRTLGSRRAAPAFPYSPSGTFSPSPPAPLAGRLSLCGGSQSSSASRSSLECLPRRGLSQGLGHVGIQTGGRERQPSGGSAVRQQRPREPGGHRAAQRAPLFRALPLCASEPVAACCPRGCPCRHGVHSGGSRLRRRGAAGGDTPLRRHPALAPKSTSAAHL